MAFRLSSHPRAAWRDSVEKEASQRSSTTENDSIETDVPKKLSEESVAHCTAN